MLLNQNISPLLSQIWPYIASCLQKLLFVLLFQYTFSYVLFENYAVIFINVYKCKWMLNVLLRCSRPNSTRLTWYVEKPELVDGRINTYLGTLGCNFLVPDNISAGLVRHRMYLNYRVHSLYFHYLFIYPSAHNQLNERFSGNQLFLNSPNIILQKKKLLHFCILLTDRAPQSRNPRHPPKNIFAWTYQFCQAGGF